MQSLFTDDGHCAAYCPLWPGAIDKNLKRWKMLNCLEVHVFYALVYTLCMSKEGILHFRNYFSAKDEKVFDPYFIA